MLWPPPSCFTPTNGISTFRRRFGHLAIFSLTYSHMDQEPASVSGSFSRHLPRSCMPDGGRHRGEQTSRRRSELQVVEKGRARPQHRWPYEYGRRSRLNSYRAGADRILSLFFFKQKTAYEI